MLETEHTKECQEGQRREQEWLTQWPNHCKECRGFGEFTSNYDPIGGVGSLSSGYYLWREPCEACTYQGICPRCGKAGLSNVDEGRGDDIGAGPCTECGWDYPMGGRPVYPCFCIEEYCRKREESWV